MSTSLAFSEMCAGIFGDTNGVFSGLGWILSPVFFQLFSESLLISTVSYGKKLDEVFWSGSLLPSCTVTSSLCWKGQRSPSLLHFILTPQLSLPGWKVPIDSVIPHNGAVSQFWSSLLPSMVLPCPAGKGEGSQQHEAVRVWQMAFLVIPNTGY